MHVVGKDPFYENNKSSLALFDLTNKFNLSSENVVSFQTSCIMSLTESNQLGGEIPLKIITFFVYGKKRFFI